LFVSGTPANVRQGSGTYVGISVLRRALEARGCHIDLAAPAAASPGAWRRLWFNVRLRGYDLPAYSAVVGFDLDGVLLPRRASRGWRDVAAIKGVLAEEMQFERGFIRGRLGMQAWFERRRVHQADRVLVTSRYAAAAIASHYGLALERIRVVPELIDLDAWRERLTGELAPAAGPPVILCVAHLYPRKDVATLLEATARLRHPARVHVVGDGPERGRLQATAARLRLGERVEFLGHVPLARLTEEYRRASLFCLPSRQEGFGIVLLEAMAAGLPIVAARAAAIPEVVVEDEGALLFPPGDAAALAACLDGLLADSDARHRLGAFGHRHVLRYDAPRVAEVFLAALA
jgi:glycosyltransferase involved in cell wall biosynthesis